MTEESWQKITVPRVRRGPEPSLGQSAFSKRTGKPKRMVSADRKAHLAAHGACVDHVKLETGTICILRGQDRDAVIAEARAIG